MPQSDLYQQSCENESPTKKPCDESQLRKPILNEAYEDSLFRDDVTMRDASEDGQTLGGPGTAWEQSPEPPSRRSKGRPSSALYRAVSNELPKDDGFEASRPNVGRKQLWTADQDTSSRPAPSNIASIQAQKSRQRLQTLGKSTSPQMMSLTQRTQTVPQESSFTTTPLIQPSPRRLTRQEDTYDILRLEARPISQEQLVPEVKGIYAGLVMVEARCIKVHATLAQADPGAQPKLNNEQWQALIALHRTLLHEHHDFFLASQHPSASIALRRLASKYAMPARMWRHGIHSFLELLRHRLPASLDHMLAFIYLAYSIMALLYETVPAFEDTWIEGLGDLARYRMAIEDNDIRDREVWTGVARHWYSKASDKATTTGRLYHHLAILARPNALQQLFYYSKSLCVEIPFTSARESILTLFEPVINAVGPAQYRLPPLDTAYVKAHGYLFAGRDMDKFEPIVKEFLALLDNQIGRVTRKFMEQGYHIAVANSVAVLGFATGDDVLMKAISASQGKAVVESKSAAPEDPEVAIARFRRAQSLFNQTFQIVLQRIGDPNVLPFVHVTLVHILYVSAYSDAMSLIQDDLPWGLLSAMLNTLLGTYRTPDRIESDKFPLPEKDEVRPLPEDYAIRGLLWTVLYFPEQWFDNDKIDEEEKYREIASMTEQRKERICWLACKICKRCPRMRYSREGFFPESPANEGIPIHTGRMLLVDQNR